MSTREQSTAEVIVGIGELLWDMLPSGCRLGGAPANFACHATALGAEAAVVSRLGADDLGREALAWLARRGVRVDGIQIDPNRPTGRVDVEVDEAGQPRYAIGPEAAWDALEWSPALHSLARRTAAVCFGTLGQRAPWARATIRRFLLEVPPEAMRVFDVNLRQNFHSAECIRDSLELATVVKLNEHELPSVLEAAGINGHASDSMSRLIDQCSLGLVVCTMGADGALLVTADEVVRVLAKPAVLVDTVGAGDAFTATLVAGMLRGLSLEMAGDRAASVAAFVCSRAGATPELPDEFRLGGTLPPHQETVDGSERMVGDAAGA